MCARARACVTVCVTVCVCVCAQVSHELLFSYLIVLPNRVVQMVIGPAEDGGYYMIGLTRVEPALFQVGPDLYLCQFFLHGHTTCSSYL